MDDTSNGTNSGPDGSSTAGMDGGSPDISASDAQMGALGATAATGGLLGVADAISGLGMAAAGFGAFGGLAAMGFAVSSIDTQSISSTLSSDPTIAASQLEAFGIYGLTAQDFGLPASADVAASTDTGGGSLPYYYQPIYYDGSDGSGQ